MRARYALPVFLCMCAAAHAGSGAPEPGPPSPATASSAQSSDPAAEAEAAVARNLGTEGGRRYRDSAASAAAGPLAAAWRACSDSLSAGGGGAKGDTAGLDVYVLLNRRGLAKGVLVKPPGKMAECLSGRLGPVLAFPNPPGPNYWIRLRATARK